MITAPNTITAISLAARDDAEAVVNLWHSLIGYPGCTWSYEYPNAENFQIDVTNGALWCLRVNGELAGVVTIGRSGDVAALGWEPQNPAELARLAVARKYQGQGLASVLVAHALQVAQVNGHGGVILLVSPLHTQAQHLYESHGFQPDGEVFGWNHQWLRYQQTF